MHHGPSRLAFDLLTFLGNALWQVAAIAAIAGLLGRLLNGSSARLRNQFYTLALVASFLAPLAGVFVPKHGDSAAFSGTRSPGFSLGATLGFHDGAVLLDGPVANLLLALALMFAAWRLVALLVAARRTRALASSSSCLLGEDHVQLVQRAATALGVRRFQALTSPAISGPLTFGWFQPTIVIPARLIEESSPELLSAAFGHELAHIRRRDFLWNVIFELLLTPLAFHPGAWFLKRRVDETRELACDEIVAEELIEPRLYARCLLRMATFALGGPRHSYAMKAVAPPLLYERIQRLLAEGPRRHVALHRAASLSLLAFTTLASTHLALPFVGMTCSNGGDCATVIDWAHEGTAACVAGDSVRAMEAWEHLDGTGRALLEVDCANVGIGYCSERHGFFPFKEEDP